MSGAEDERSGPVFIHEPVNRVDFSNTTGATVECSAMGTPTPEIVWIRSNGTAVTDVPGLRQVRVRRHRHVDIDTSTLTRRH